MQDSRAGIRIEGVAAGARERAGRRQQALLVVLLLVAAQVALVAWPAYACGCGGMVPGKGSRIAVDRETSVVRWDGRTEQIVMRLSVSGDAREAAWVMPVPHRATVELGDRELFREAERLTSPEVRERRYFWPRAGDWPLDETDGVGAPAPGAGAPRPPVGVVGREQLGPFDVARLTATDEGALRDWLTGNGFSLPARMAAELGPYVAREWEYVAVRLAPEPDGGADGTGTGEGQPVLGGTLDPLHLTFASERLVYPMRLSRAARQPQALRLYVLAPHRMEPVSSIGGDEPEVTFAGRIDSGSEGSTGSEGKSGDAEEAGSAAASGPMAELATGARFLTAFEQDFPRPGRISGDHLLRRAADDTPFRRVEYDDELLTWGGVPAWLVTVAGLGALLTAAVVVAALRRRARAAAPGTA